MSLHNEFKIFLSKIDKSKFSTYTGKGGGYITFENTGNPVKAFTLSLESILSGFSDIENNISNFIGHSSYDEKAWRDLGGNYFTDRALKSISTVQTKPLFTTFSKIISWANDRAHTNDNHIDLDGNSLSVTKVKLLQLINEYQPKQLQPRFKVNSIIAVTLPKPFILLSGISGTGKTRFVKQQANRFKQDDSNYCIVPVRPDWHEPSDLLGYISRLGKNGTEYIVTDFLQFIVAAWKDITQSIAQDEVLYNDDCVPYWLCLDEMNLAPVEQYFADYLSIIETRYWDDEKQYHCNPLLTPGLFTQLDAAGLATLQTHLKLSDDHELWEYFLNNGISIPPNLIVAGTVNMDETTHGFSRKVIDRAFTIDFGEFFPNDYQAYFVSQTQPKTLGFPTLSQVGINDIAEYDPNGGNSIAFLEALNSVLKGSPFELAYRALNELLIAVVCFKPNGALELQAVWDDFLMTKVLPRIEGDSEKLHDNGESSLLIQLESVLAEHLTEIWEDTKDRPDLLRENIEGNILFIKCRSKKKISWMKARLSANGFTSFWP